MARFCVSNEAALDVEYRDQDGFCETSLCCGTARGRWGNICVWFCTWIAENQVPGRVIR
jgi:hypothetical protein